jgi:choice-of-anchor A domain-containing protein
MPAQAASIDPLDLLQSYNAISLEDFNMSASHVEGTMFVGGDLNIASSTDVNGDNQIPDAGTGLSAALVVGGDVNGGDIKVLNGDAAIGGSANGNVAMNGGGTLTQGAFVPVADVTASMTGLSSQMAALETSAGAGLNYNSGTKRNELSLGTGNADGFAVLNLTQTQWADLNAIDINNLSTSAFNGVFINVAGDSFTRTGNWNAQASNVILNFFEATSFANLNGNLNFSVLAPLADVTTAGSGMNGFVVGKTITNSAEIRPPFTNNPINYTGSLPAPEMAPVPLPAAAWMLLAALGSLGLMRTRARG